MSGPTEGRAEDNGRVYQSSGDQHITEHHHHGDAPIAASGMAPDSVRRPAIGRPPVVLRDRMELMARLRTALEEGGAHQVYVLHGLGGCGKTAVAAEIFRSATAGGGRIGLWVNASDATSLRAGMLAVAADRGRRWRSVDCSTTRSLASPPVRLAVCAPMGCCSTASPGAPRQIIVTRLSVLPPDCSARYCPT